METIILPHNYHIINQLGDRTYPHKRIQIVRSNNLMIEPPDDYMYEPVSPPYNIVATLNLALYRNIPTIHIMDIRDTNKERIIKYLLSLIEDYHEAVYNGAIFASRLQYSINYLHDYGFSYDTETRLYQRKVAERK